MPTVALQAHFNGDPIVLDEPFDHPPHAPLIVSLLPQPDTERNGLTMRWSDPRRATADVKPHGPHCFTGLPSTPPAGQGADLGSQATRAHLLQIDPDDT